MPEFDEEALAAARAELNGDEPQQPREFLFACRISEIPSDGKRGKVVRYDDTEVALFNFSGEIFAISNICPHEMSPLLAAGQVNLEAKTVACPLHGWTFEIPTGKLVGATGRVDTYEVRVESDEVWIRLRER